MGVIIGWLAVTLTGAGIGGAAALFIAHAVVRLAISLAVTVVQSLLTKNQQKPLPSGIRTNFTQTGGTNPTSFILGTYATAGARICPPMSHGTAGQTPNAYLNYVISLSDVRGMSLNRVAVDGQWMTLGGTPHVDYGFPMVDFQVAGVDHAWVTYYDGTQTGVDPMLLSKYGAMASRPWLSDMIGRDVCYAIVTFRFNQELFGNGYPQCRFELLGIKLYDPRADTSVGGSGAQRWATPSTWAFSDNPKVMQYNIFRGISFADGSIWGGDTAAADLPLSEWFAMMNACDALVTKSGGGTEKAYRAGMEVFSSDEPMSILEELDKACSGQLVDMGGVWKGRVGAVGLPVLFITDDDVLVTRAQEYAPFPNLTGTFNGVSAQYPEPISMYESVSAPIRTNSADETADGGRRLMADLALSAVPYADQVQRLMEAYRLDNRRLRSHGLTLGPAAMLCEPTDAISWTSAANGYTAKVFEISQDADDPMTGLQRFAVRERDSADYSVPSYLAKNQIAGAMVTPTTQTVGGFTVSAVSLVADGGLQTRPALTVAWNGNGQNDVLAIKVQVRLVSTFAIVSSGSTHDVELGYLTITNGVMPATAYQARVRFVVRGRPTAWTGWAASSPSTTPAVAGFPVTGLADIASATMLGNNAGVSAAPIALTVAQTKTMLTLSTADMSDFIESVDDRVAALCAGSTQIAVTYNDPAGTLTFSIVAASIDTAQITNDAVSDTKLANMPANTVKVNATGALANPQNLALANSNLLGRGSAGVIAPITLGTGLAMTGTVLSAAGGGSVTITQLTVDFVTPSRAAFFDVTLTGAVVGQKVVAAPSLDMPSGVSEDEMEMDPIAVAGRVVATNTVRLLVSSSGVISGQRNINVMVT